MTKQVVAKRVLGLSAAAVVIACSASSANATVASDISVRLDDRPGITITGEFAVPSPYRYITFAFTQPVDHSRPDRGTFEQRGSVLFRGDSRPTAFETPGYDLPDFPFRGEITSLLDANQVALEHGHFPGSRPQPVAWDTLTITQVATDHHRLVQTLRLLFTGAWVSTGSSKGGMSAVHHRAFFPQDVDGTIAYSASSDIDDTNDTAYHDIFRTSGSPQCRARLDHYLRQMLTDRRDVLAALRKLADQDKLTFAEFDGGLEGAFENSLANFRWKLYQSSASLEQDCAAIPGQSATSKKRVDFYFANVGLYTDAFIQRSRTSFGIYVFQAVRELGYPKAVHAIDSLRSLRRHEPLNVRVQVPQDVPDEIRRLDTDHMRQIHATIKQTGRNTRPPGLSAGASPQCAGQPHTRFVERQC
ncbi:S28 family serine protease [Lentzea sp. HUAS12]|uniref:S28 family serine protease n=1 Tax=Lentzea sp. HUAS12 TaxID=2951806 RepID=UPI00209EB90C|nr:S28 family serine protease [Lentzea sp. HUAS12]USX56382.1 hypothetical protein ND450_20450 [Lentzea sp. HUAS12]